MAWLSGLIEHPFLLLLAALVAAPILRQYFRWFFGDVDGFVSDAREGLTPDWYLLLKHGWSRYCEGEWAEFKIAFFVFVCIALVASFYKAATVVFY